MYMTQTAQSVKTAIGPGILDRLHKEDAASKIAEILNNDDDWYSKLQALNLAYEGHGVEAFRSDGMSSDDLPLACYVNAGDLYAPTFVYDFSADNGVQITDMGSWREKSGY